MAEVNARMQRTAAVAKAARAATILPGLLGFLIFFVKDVQAAGFSVFGTFVHLVMTNYDPRQKKRVLQVFTVTFSGAVMIAWGTAVSMWLWLAVLSACFVGFATQTASLFHGMIGASRTVVLLAFMVAVTAPALVANIVPRLGGWALSGVVALLCILTTWISFGMVKPAESMTRAASTPSFPLADVSYFGRGPGFRGLARRFQATLDTQPDWFASCTRAAVAAGLAVLIGGVFKVEHGTFSEIINTDGRRRPFAPCSSCSVWRCAYRPSAFALFAQTSSSSALRTIGLYSEERIGPPTISSLHSRPLPGRHF